MTGLYVIIAVAGLTVLVLGLFAGYVKNRLWMAEATICLLVGVAVGPAVFDFVDPSTFKTEPAFLLQEVTRLTLGIAVMGAALRLPRGYERRHWRSLAIILGLGMPLMWLTGTAMAALCLGLPFLPALAMGAAMSPTDPVVAGSIAGGKLTERLVTARIRNLLISESGANDGIALLYVMLPVLLLIHPVGEAFKLWGLETFLWEIVLAVALGAAAGWICGRILDWAYRQTFSERHSMLTIGLALSVTVLAFVHMMGSDGILAVFVSGLVLNRYIAKREAGQQHVQQVIARFFDLPAFVFLGTVLPWDEWGKLGWRGIGFAAAILLLRRLPWWLLLCRITPEMNRRYEAVFLGWFGPLGLSTVFYVLLIQQEAGLKDLWPAASLVVAASIVLHGISATPLTHWAGRHGDQRDLPPVTSPAEKLAESESPEGEHQGSAEQGGSAEDASGQEAADPGAAEDPPEGKRRTAAPRDRDQHRA